MSESPRRLVHQDPDFARLVEASRHHEPSSKGFDETLSLVTQAVRGGAPSTDGDRDTRTRSALRSSTSHLLGGAALVGAVVYGLSTIWSAPPPPSAGVASPAGTTPNASPSVNAPEPPRASVPVEALAEAPSTAASAQPPSLTSPEATGTRAASPRPDESAAPARGARVAREVDASPSSSVARASLREELALVSAARTALEGNDFASCLRATDQYDERFRSGILRQEIEVIRMTALVRSGERSRGETLARRFLASNGDSPYASQVRSLLERP